MEFYRKILEESMLEERLDSGAEVQLNMQPELQSSGSDQNAFVF